MFGIFIINSPHSQFIILNDFFWNINFLSMMINFRNSNKQRKSYKKSEKKLIIHYWFQNGSLLKLNREFRKHNGQKNIFCYDQSSLNNRASNTWNTNKCIIWTLILQKKKSPHGLLKLTDTIIEITTRTEP